MDLNNSPLIKKIYANPNLRQNMMNKGTMFLYCDYAGFASRNAYAVACCTVYNQTVSLTAKKLPIERDQGSNYGEMMAITLGLETLKAALLGCQPKIAVIFTDCSRISRILAQDRFSHPHDELGRAKLLAALENISYLCSHVDVQIKYMSKHKKNNVLHRLAHNAAREAALAYDADIAEHEISNGWSRGG